MIDFVYRRAKKDITKMRETNNKRKLKIYVYFVIVYSAHLPHVRFIMR
jgi:hypothetical protein